MKNVVVLGIVAGCVEEFYQRRRFCIKLLRRFVAVVLSVSD